jgi:hypothetical protein
VTIVPGGAAQALTITTPGQNGVLPFNATAGQRVSLWISGNMTGCTDVSIRHPAPDETVLVSNWCVGTTTYFLDTVTLATGGLHRVVVNPDRFHTGSATFTLYDVPGDATDTLVAGGATVTLPMTTPGQNGLLTFSGTASQRGSLNIGNTGTLTGCTGGSIRMPAPEESVLASDSCVVPSNGEFFEPITLPADGVYRVVVNPSGANAGTLPFTLYNVPPDVTGSLTVNGATLPLTISGTGATSCSTARASRRRGASSRRCSPASCCTA